MMKKKTGQYIFLFMIMLLAGLFWNSCQVGLFDIIKSEVEEYEAAQAGSPEFVLIKGATEFEEGADVPIGSVLEDVGKDVTFSIENQGSAPLQLPGSPRLTISGTHADDFAIVSLPAAVIAPGSKSDFILEFLPADPGSKTADVSIPNSDTAGGTFTFTMSGESTGTPGPEIQVSQDSTIIDETPAYEADFGTLFAGDSAELDFVIQNIGTSASSLHITSHPTGVSISGGSGYFSVTLQPGNEYLTEGDPLDDNTTFKIEYQPSTVGTHTATVSIANDDTDENPYQFDITGSCTALDIAFLVDTSGSMVMNMAAIQAGISDAMPVISTIDSLAQFGLAEFDDFPIGSFGIPGWDIHYEREQDLTTSQVSVNAALGVLSASGGADTPGSVLDGLAGVCGVESTAPPTDGDGSTDAMNWRTGSIRMVILISHSPPHNYQYFAGGYPGLHVPDTLAALQGDDVAGCGLLFTNGVGFPTLVDLFGNEIAPATGGAFRPYSGNFAADVVDIIQEVVDNQ